MDFMWVPRLLDGQLANHARLEVAGLKAGELEDAGLRELPDNLALRARLHVSHVRVGVFYLRELLHQLGMLLDRLRRAENHLVQKLAAVAHDEANRLAASHGH